MLSSVTQCIRIARRFSLMRDDFSVCFELRDGGNRRPDGFSEGVCHAGREPSELPVKETPCINTVGKYTGTALSYLKGEGFPFPTLAPINYIFLFLLHKHEGLCHEAQTVKA